MREPEYLTPTRKTLLIWLESHAGELAKLYGDALELLFGSNVFCARLYLVAHAVREIRNRLPDAVVGVTAKSRLDYVQRMDAVAQLWSREFRVDDSGAEVSLSSQAHVPANDTVEISQRLFRKISALIKDHSERTTARENARRMFLEKSPEYADSPEALDPVVANWMEQTKWFQKAHVSDVKHNEWDEKEFLHQFEIFEREMGSLINEFYREVDQLDDVLAKANKRRD